MAGTQLPDPITLDNNTLYFFVDESYRSKGEFDDDKYYYAGGVLGTGLQLNNLAREIDSLISEAVEKHCSERVKDYVKEHGIHAIELHLQDIKFHKVPAPDPSSPKFKTIQELAWREISAAGASTKLITDISAAIKDCSCIALIRGIHDFRFKEYKGDSKAALHSWAVIYLLEEVSKRQRRSFDYEKAKTVPHSNDGKGIHITVYYDENRGADKTLNEYFEKAKAPYYEAEREFKNVDLRHIANIAPVKSEQHRAAQAADLIVYMVRRLFDEYILAKPSKAAAAIACLEALDEAYHIYRWYPVRPGLQHTDRYLRELSDAVLGVIDDDDVKEKVRTAIRDYSKGYREAHDTKKKKNKQTGKSEEAAVAASEGKVKK